MYFIFVPLCWDVELSIYLIMMWRGLSHWEYFGSRDESAALPGNENQVMARTELPWMRYLNDNHMQIMVSSERERNMNVKWGRLGLLHPVLVYCGRIDKSATHGLERSSDYPTEHGQKHCHNNHMRIMGCTRGEIET